MAGKRKATDAAGGVHVAKKRTVNQPCRLCPAEDKHRSNYGRLDETTKGGWLYYCCTSCFHKLKEKGDDISNLISASTAKKLKDDAAGVVAKKKPVGWPCRLCPAEDKTKSNYGRLDEKDKWIYVCCTACYEKLKEEGEDVSDLIAHRKAKKLRDDAAGVVAKKQPVLKPCRLCPADDKHRSYYGHWDEKTTTWTFYCCTGCFQKLKDNGEDVSKLITSYEAVNLKNGKRHGSCQHGDCTTIATYGPWDDTHKTFSRLLCQLHYKQAISSCEAADESVHLYINESRAKQLRTGKREYECWEDGCTTKASFGLPGPHFSPTHCQEHSNSATMVSSTVNLRTYHPDKAAAKADRRALHDKEVTECPGTLDGVACTHTGRKRYNEARCCFCTDNVKADQLQPGDYNHKFEKIGHQVSWWRLQMLKEELPGKYTFKAEVTMLNLGFGQFKADTFAARRDYLIADAASVEVFASNSTSLRAYMRSEGKAMAPLRLEQFPSQTKVEMLHKLMIPDHFLRNTPLLDRAIAILKGKSIGIFEIDEGGHPGYGVHNELCRVLSALDLAPGSITTLMKMVPDANKFSDPLDWPASPRDRISSALKLMVETMGQATQDSVTYLFYPCTSKHLEAARKTLLPRTDIKVYINPKTAPTSHAAPCKSYPRSAQKTLDSFFS